MTAPHPSSIDFNRRLGVALMLFTLLLAACGGGDHVDPGLIRAPHFSEEAGRLARPWQFAHHASSDSYRLTVADGTASIERIGHEPWARLAQEIDREKLAEVAGRRAEFSVELRARLDQAGYGDPIEPTGLMVRLWRLSTGGNPMLNAMVGSARPRIERLDLAPDARIDRWQRHVLEFSVPEDVSRLEVSAILATGGVLELRNPSLRVVDD